MFAGVGIHACMYSIAVCATGRHCFDGIASALGVSAEEVQEECERGPYRAEILVIARMSSDEG